MMMDHKTVCVFGDSVALGDGDAQGGGWPLRLARLEADAGFPLTLYNLSVARDTSVDIADRWSVDCQSRLRGIGGVRGAPDRTGQGGLVFAFGLYDMAERADASADGLQVPLMESMAQADAILGAAARAWPTLWIGPAPVRPRSAPLLESGCWLRFSRARLEALNAAYADIAARLRIPYLDLMEVAAADPAWVAAQNFGNGIHPSAEGHAVIARLVHGWPAWRRWMDDAAMEHRRAG